MATNNVCSAIVAEVLRDDNYPKWSACLKNYLLAQDLWDIVEATTDEPPKPEDCEEEYKVWRKKNAAALHAIQISCGPEMLSHVIEMTSASIAWKRLAEMHETQGTDDENYAKFQPLVQAINRGDLKAVKEFIEHTTDAISAKIDIYGSRALHFAISAGQDEIAIELVKLMSAEELRLPDGNDFTALHQAAVVGNLKIAKCIISENKNILSIGAGGRIPVVSASGEVQKKMTRYLYSVTPHELLNGDIGSALICNAIMVKLLDIALDLIKKFPHLATVPRRSGNIPLEPLACMPSLFPSGIQLSFWKRIIYQCIHVELPSSSNDFRVDISQNEENDKENISQLQVTGQIRKMCLTLLEFVGVKELYDMKLNQLYAMEILNCMCQKLPTSYNSGVRRAFFKAINCGTVEFVVELCKANPLLLSAVDNHSRNFFYLATRLRHEKIFNLIYGLNKRKNSITNGIDKFRNCPLHLVAMLAPPSQLARISGAALKMQRELQWYKEVERLVGPSFNLLRNKNMELPYEVFTKEHKDLMKEGEAWMKENATSCSFVAALIITIMFAAAFTVPGGNDQNTGYPIFLHQTSFKLFVMADVVSLFTATTSVLMFLGILTSRYKAEDFLKSLPTKLIIGLSTLFISIAAMVMAFCVALIIMFKGQLKIIIPIVVLASFPITAFVWLQFPLLIEIFMSTYGPSIFKRKIKRWL